jgi:hypothetical protein
MFMSKQPVSVTLERDNLLWLRGRRTGRKRRSLSDALDEVITAARLTGDGGQIRSVVGTIDLAADDPRLERADLHIRGEFERSRADAGIAEQGEPAVARARGPAAAAGKTRGRA